MALSSIARSSDTDHRDAVSAALSAICWQHEHGTPTAQLVHEHRGINEAGQKYLVTDVDTDPGNDWWPVTLVTTSGTVYDYGRGASDAPEVVETVAARSGLSVNETADILAGFRAGIERAERGDLR